MSNDFDDHKKYFPDHAYTRPKGWRPTDVSFELAALAGPSRKAYKTPQEVACFEPDELSDVVETDEERDLVFATDEDEKDALPGDEENDELGRLLNIKNKHAAIDSQLPGSTPTRGFFFGKDGYQGNTEAFRNSLGRDGLGSLGSYETAKSSFASYKTAPHSFSIRGSLPSPSRASHLSRNTVLLGHVPSTSDTARDILIEDIVRETSSFVRKGQTASTNVFLSIIACRIKTYASTNDSYSNTLFDEIALNLLIYARSPTRPGKDHLKGAVAALLSRVHPSSQGVAVQVFTSEWIEYLRLRGLIPDPTEELDWSGRGQHVEYAPDEQSKIPLKTEKVLGFSKSALVESVMCRRIRLARKTIRCTRRLSQKDAITEVEHLQRLQHAHIVRVVGTYTFQKNLAILLYPAAEWNLEEFLDTLIEDPDLAAGETSLRTRALVSFFGCLSNAVNFIHRWNVKHMDLKPKNLLIQRVSKYHPTYKIYIADFGIARSYQSAAEAETDSPTSYTPTYAAPEVVLQNTRGFKADIFSLGCVFMEILATLISRPDRNELLELRKVRRDSCGDTSYQANVGAVLAWFDGVHSLATELEGFKVEFDRHAGPHFLTQVPSMIHISPDSRPSANSLLAKEWIIDCQDCHRGPEPFEAARPMFT